MKPPRTRVYVANADSREISVLALDPASGDATLLQTVAVSGSVMPLAVSPDRRVLHAALRSEPFAVASFAIDRASGLLTPLATAPLPDSMAHIATDRSGRWLFAASYGGDIVSVSAIDADGAAGAAVQVLPTGRNAHAAVPGPDNRHVYVTNLGADQVMQFDFDAASGRLSPNRVPLVQARAGSGPRHLVFHPNGRHAYLLGELDAGVDLLERDAATGTLRALRSWSTLPSGFSGQPWAADLHLTPDGRFLYTSERRSSLLATWAVDAASGELTLVGHVATATQPRGFAIDPGGRWLLAAGQLSNTLSVHGIDAASGRLDAGRSIALGSNPNWVEAIALP